LSIFEGKFCPGPVTIDLLGLKFKNRACNIYINIYILKAGILSEKAGIIEMESSGQW
jgi:hypothetical protein